VKCSRCGEEKPIVQILQDSKGDRYPLCAPCAKRFNESEEEWPLNEAKRPIPTNTKRTKNELKSLRTE